jgi:hypothetical protein
VALRHSQQLRKKEKKEKKMLNFKQTRKKKKSYDSTYPEAIYNPKASLLSSSS